MKSNTIVILHGWGLSADKFQPLASVLRDKGYKVHSIDLPGFGLTQIPVKPFTMGDYVEFVENYLKVNNIVKPIIIGHSFGGRVALSVAHAYPDKVHSLILTGTPGFRTASLLKLIVGKVLARAGNTFFSLPPFAISRFLVRDVFYRALGVRDYVKAKGVMKDTFKLIVDYNLVPAMKELSVPVLLIWGQVDGMVPVRIAQRMQKTMKNAKLVIIPDANHRVPYMQPSEFVHEIEKFMED